MQEPHNVTIDFGGGITGGPDTMTLTLNADQTTFDYPLPQYAQVGTYTVTVTVADADGTNSTSTSVDVYYTNTQPSALALSLDQTTISAGGSVNLSGTFTDAQASFAHTVTINWGDGGGSPDITTLAVGAGQTTFQASA